MLNPYSNCKGLSLTCTSSEVFDVDLHEAAMNLALHRLFVPFVKQAQNGPDQDTRADQRIRADENGRQTTSTQPASSIFSRKQTEIFVVCDCYYAAKSNALLEVQEVPSNTQTHLG